MTSRRSDRHGTPASGHAEPGPRRRSSARPGRPARSRHMVTSSSRGEVPDPPVQDSLLHPAPDAWPCATAARRERRLLFTAPRSAPARPGCVMRPPSRVLESIRPAQGMSAPDAALWRSARSLAEVGELTTRWLHGRIASPPGCGPDDETIRGGLAPVLATCRRARHVTTGVRPGEPADARCWVERSAVKGLCGMSVLRRIRNACVLAGPAPGEHGPAALPGRRARPDVAIVKTRGPGRNVALTRSSSQMPRPHIAGDPAGRACATRTQ